MKKENTNVANRTNDTNGEKILYKDLSYQIIECAFEVHNVLGPICDRFSIVAPS